MKKSLIVLSAVMIIIAAPLVFWPRMPVQEDTTFSLLCHGLDSRDVLIPLGAEDSAVLCDILMKAPCLPDWTNTIPGQRFYYDDWHTCGILVNGLNDYNLFLVLPKQGSRHLLQVLGGKKDTLLWLNSDNLDDLAAMFETHGMFYPPVLSE